MLIDLFAQPGNLQVQEVDVYKELTLSVVTQIELSWWLDGKYPDQATLESKFSINGNTLSLIEPRINEILGTRDLPPVDFLRTQFSEAKKVEPDLDPYFVVAVNLLCDTLDKRSKAVKLNTVGLSTKKFNVFMEKKAYKEYFRLRVDKVFGNVSESAKLSLAKAVEAGDLQAIKYYHEYTREFDPNKESTLNLNRLIMLFMEILIRHVSPNVVEAVARDFDVKLLELKQ